MARTSRRSQRQDSHLVSPGELQDDRAAAKLTACESDALRRLRDAADGRAIWQSLHEPLHGTVCSSLHAAWLSWTAHCICLGSSSSSSSIYSNQPGWLVSHYSACPGRSSSSPPQFRSRQRLHLRLLASAGSSADSSAPAAVPAAAQYSDIATFLTLQSACSRQLLQAIKQQHTVLTSPSSV